MSKKQLKWQLQFYQIMHDRYPTDPDFEEKSNELVRVIFFKKIDMLGSYLQ